MSCPSCCARTGTTAEATKNSAARTSVQSFKYENGNFIASPRKIVRRGACPRGQPVLIEGARVRFQPCGSRKRFRGKLDQKNAQEEVRAARRAGRRVLRGCESGDGDGCGLCQYLRRVRRQFARAVFLRGQLAEARGRCGQVAPAHAVSAGSCRGPAVDGLCPTLMRGVGSVVRLRRALRRLMTRTRMMLGRGALDFLAAAGVVFTRRVRAEGGGKRPAPAAQEQREQDDSDVRSKPPHKV